MTGWEGMYIVFASYLCCLRLVNIPKGNLHRTSSQLFPQLSILSTLPLTLSLSLSLSFRPPFLQLWRAHPHDQHTSRRPRNYRTTLPHRSAPIHPPRRFWRRWSQQRRRRRGARNRVPTHPNRVHPVRATHVPTLRNGRRPAGLARRQHALPVLPRRHVRHGAAAQEPLRQGHRGGKASQRRRQGHDRGVRWRPAPHLLPGRWRVRNAGARCSRCL